MATLPRGPLTLLFTDIEGSTRLVDALGDRYGSVLRAHRRIIRRAVVEAGGHEVDCRADEFFVVFAEPAAAVAAASAAQQALAAHAWPPGHPVRVRMGVHTGRPTRVRDDYIGVDVHRAARVCAAAHGGQVFLSAAVCDALGDTASSLRDLGEHLLRGLPAPERLFQLIVPGLPLGPAPVGEAAREGPRTRVVLADDSVLLREGIGRLLEDAGFEIAAQSGTADDLLRDVAAHAPDVAIVDLRMPPTHTDEGLQAAKEIRRCHPGVGVLVLSQFVEPAYARELLGTGTEGVGYLLKDRVADVAEFAAAVRCVAEGGSALDPTLPSL